MNYRKKGITAVVAAMALLSFFSNIPYTYLCVYTEEADSVLEPIDWLACPLSGVQHENSQAHNYPFVLIPLPKSAGKFYDRIKKEVKR